MILDAVETATRRLEGARLPSPRTDARLLLGHVLGMTKEAIIAHGADAIPPAALAAYGRLVERRLGGEPVAYLRGVKEFWSLPFIVDSRVLIPRPDTEILVDACIRALGGAADGTWVADVGTGCGAVAVAIAHTLPWVRVIATDTSQGALLLARANVGRHGLGHRIALARADLLSPVRTGRAALGCVAANLPYVPDGEIDGLDAGVRDHEPREALAGGEDGLAMVRRLASAAPAAILPGGTLALEIADSQAGIVAAMLDADPAWTGVRMERDMGGLKRVVVARRAGT